MAKTNAQRQALYRQRRPYSGTDGNGERRLALWVDTGTALALERLACHEGLTQRAVLERLVAEADREVEARLDIDSPAWGKYFDRRRSTLTKLRPGRKKTSVTP